MIGKREAKRIALSGLITWGELQALLWKAYEQGAANEEPSVVNQTITKGRVFNLMVGWAKEFTPETLVASGAGGSVRTYDWRAAMHIIREFGKFWKGYRLPKSEPKSPLIPSHEAALAPPIEFGEQTMVPDREVKDGYF